MTEGLLAHHHEVKYPYARWTDVEEGACLTTF
jgi:hypothetical protein